MVQDLFNTMLNEYIDREANVRAVKSLEPLMDDIISIVSSYNVSRELEFKLVQIKASLVDRIKKEN